MQIFYSLLDLAYHSENPLSVSTTERYAEYQKKYESRFTTLLTNCLFRYFPYFSDTEEKMWWHARFGHLVGYGAAYYSYIYCRLYSTAIWKELLQEVCKVLKHALTVLKNPLSRELGERIQQYLLTPGGGQDPERRLLELLGRDKITTGAFLSEIGL